MKFCFAVCDTPMALTVQHCAGCSHFLLAVLSRCTLVARTQHMCGVLQGSVPDPILFTQYTADVVNIVLAHGFTAHCYADDHQLYVHSWPSVTPAAIGRLIG